MRGGGIVPDGWLFLVLAALLAAVVTTASGAARRHLRRAGGRALGAVVGGASLMALAGVAVMVQSGPEAGHDALRRLWLDVLPPPALPRAHHPTPLSPRVPAREASPGADVGRARLDGTVTWVRDGDTIVVGRTPIRFSDVDCAESGTQEGERATAALRQLAAGRVVQCHLIGRRSYDREIGTCALQDGRDLGRALVARGLCTLRRR